MTWWIILLVIIGGLILLSLILLSFSITAHIEYNGQNSKNDFSAKIKYLFFTVYNSDSNKKKKKKKSKKKKQKKSKANKSKKKRETFAERISKESGVDTLINDVKSGNSTSFDFGMFKIMYDSVKLPIKRLIRKLRIENLIINCIIGGDDAAKVALSYGLQSAAISGFLAWANELIKLKAKKINVTADFSKKETDLYMKCKIKLRVFSMAVFALQYIINTSKTLKK